MNPDTALTTSGPTVQALESVLASLGGILVVACLLGLGFALVRWLISSDEEEDRTLLAKKRAFTIVATGTACAVLVSGSVAGGWAKDAFDAFGGGTAAHLKGSAASAGSGGPSAGDFLPSNDAYRPNVDFGPAGSGGGGNFTQGGNELSDDDGVAGLVTNAMAREVNEKMSANSKSAANTGADFARAVLALHDAGATSVYQVETNAALRRLLASYGVDDVWDPVLYAEEYRTRKVISALKLGLSQSGGGAR